ncbi:MAG: FtsQ-type POTRA domain-containing protein [Opitutaceae bacterium]|nr:FtsQ-type POTRA domain-containing protein [Verrucomicrobiales bacterium]
MIFRRKNRNRRFEQARILNVKLSSNHVRSARLRFLGLGLSIVCGALVVTFILWRGGEWLLDRLIYDNGAFAVRHIDPQTDGVLSTNYLRVCAGVKPGANLFVVDLNQVRRNLELVPWIKSAAVERILPDTLKIRVTERTPVAQFITWQAQANGAPPLRVTNHFDAAGFVMLPLNRLYREGSVPVMDQFPEISGSAMSGVPPGRYEENPQVRAALRLVEEFERSPMSGVVDITRIDVSTPGVLQCYTSQGAEATLPLDNLGQQLNRWRLAWDHARERGRFIASIDLSISKNVPTRQVDASSVNPPPPKKSKPSRTPRRHV